MNAEPADDIEDVAELARVLTGRVPPNPARIDARLALARRHRVHLLLAGVLGADDEYRRATAQEAVRTAALRQLLSAASAHGTRPLLLKGAALAYTVYRRAWERPRSDTDVYVREDDVPAIRGALRAEGFEPAAAVDGSLVTRQFQYSRELVGGLVEHVDVHTRLFNPVIFADALRWDEADARAVPVPALGPAARALGDADALFVACVHRVAHHNDADDLIWICDIDLLARRLGGDGWETLTAVAARSGTREICRRGLARASALFATPVPADVHARLAGAREPSMVFLGGGLRELDIQRLNVRHLPRWRDRFALVRQHLFPARQYMRERYGRPAWMLPVWYAHRLCTGVPRWLRSERTREE